MGIKDGGAEKTKYTPLLILYNSHNFGLPASCISLYRNENKLTY